MSVFKAVTLGTSEAQGLDQREWLSSNLQVADEGFRFNPEITADSFPVTSSLVRAFPTSFSNTFPAGEIDYSPYFSNLIMVVSGSISPYSIEAGILVSGAILSFSLSNSISQKTEIIDFSVSDTSVFGIEGIETGVVFNPYEEKTVNLTLLSSAPVSFSTQLTLETDTFGTIVISISGVSCITFAYLPDSLNETITYKTQILTTYNGEEQRISVRKYPRYSYEVSYTLPCDHRSNAFRTLLGTGYPQSYAFPSWGMLEKLSYTPAVGESVLSFDPSKGTYQEDGLLILWQDNKVTEIYSIQSVSEDSITLASAISVTFTGIVYVAPLAACFLSQKPTYENDRLDNVYSSLSFSSLSFFDVPSYSFSMTYNDLPVVLFPNIFESKTEARSIEGGASQVDSGVGKFSLISNWNENKPTYTRGFHLRSPAECLEFRSFLDYFRGRQKTAYIPTLDRDFILTRTVESASVQLYCETNYFSRYYSVADKKIFNHIFITDGTNTYLREIVDVQDIDDDEQLIVIDSPLGTEYTTGTLKISLMPLCRQLKDAVELEWIQSGEAEAIVEFIGVPE